MGCKTSLGTASERVGPRLDLNPEPLIPNTVLSSLPPPALIPQDSHTPGEFSQMSFFPPPNFVHTHMHLYLYTHVLTGVYVCITRTYVCV